MPRVFTARAAKDYPAHDIKKGDTYYYWSFFRGPKQMSKTPPRQSQLTQTKMSEAYAAQEELENVLNMKELVLSDIVDALETAVESIRSVADEYEDQASNLSDYFPGGSPQIDDAEEKAQALIDYADALEEAKSELESLDASDYLIHDKDEDGEERKVEDFDDLLDDEREGMLEAALDIARGPTLEI